MSSENHRSLLEPEDLGLGSERFPAARGGSQLEVTVIFTTLPSTMIALGAAQELADGLGLQTLLLVPEVIPLHFPLSSPPVSHTSIERQMYRMAAECQKGGDIKVHVVLCRNAQRCVLHALKTQSLALIGEKRRWWPAPGQRLAKVMRANGHNVMFIRGD